MPQNQAIPPPSTLSTLGCYGGASPVSVVVGSDVNVVSSTLSTLGAGLSAGGGNNILTLLGRSIGGRGVVLTVGALVICAADLFCHRIIDLLRGWQTVLDLVHLIRGRLHREVYCAGLINFGRIARRIDSQLS